MRDKGIAKRGIAKVGRRVRGDRHCCEHCGVHGVWPFSCKRLNVDHARLGSERELPHFRGQLPLAINKHTRELASVFSFAVKRRHFKMRLKGRPHSSISVNHVANVAPLDDGGSLPSCLQGGKLLSF